MLLHVPSITSVQNLSEPQQEYASKACVGHAVDNMQNPTQIYATYLMSIWGGQNVVVLGESG